MTLKTYLKNRQLFESRHIPRDLGWVYLRESRYGIRNFGLFFALYSFDRRIGITNCVSSIDRDKRWYAARYNKYGTRIKVVSYTHSMFDAFPGEYTKHLLFCQQLPQAKGPYKRQ